jgi:hypothetical protein
MNQCLIGEKQSYDQDEEMYAKHNTMRKQLYSLRNLKMSFHLLTNLYTASFVASM